MDEIQDERHAGWLWLDNEIIDHYGSKIGAYGVAVYAALARYADNNSRTCFPSYKELCDKLGMSRSTLVRTLPLLEKEGLIKITTRLSTEPGQPNTSNLYTLLKVRKIPPSTTQTLGVVSHRHQGSTPETPPLVPDRHYPSVTQTPELDPINKTQFKKTRGEEPQPTTKTVAEKREPARAPDSFSEKSFNKLLADYGEERLGAAKLVASEKRENGENDFRLVGGIISRLTEGELERYRSKGKLRAVDRSGFNDPAFLAKKEKLFKEKGIPV